MRTVQRDFNIKYIKKIILILILATLSTIIVGTPSKKVYYKAPKEEAVVEVKKLDPKLEIVQKIANTFPENPRLMIAVALEESTLNPKATGYNCRYKISTSTEAVYDSLTGYSIDINKVIKDQTKGYVSTFCRKGHNSLAWSKDGGLFGIHNPTQEDYIVEVNLEKARAKYDTQGLKAWTSYNTGRYKDNLKEADHLLALLYKAK